MKKADRWSKEDKEDAINSFTKEIMDDVAREIENDPTGALKEVAEADVRREVTRIVEEAENERDDRETKPSKKSV